jgi:hypothetical protein
MDQTERMVREMGLSREEFFRTLPFVVMDRPFQIEGDTISIGWSGGSVILRLGGNHGRKLGSLNVPVMRVEFEFFGLTPSDREAFLVHFDLNYQRGGG